MKKSMIIFIVAALLAAGGCIYWKKHTTTANNAASERETAVISRGTLRKTVQCTGRIVSNLDVEIKCKASGLVVKMPYDVSDQVKKDELLLEIDPVDQARAVQQAEAALAASQAKVAQAEENLEVAAANASSERKRTAAEKDTAVARAKDSEAKAKRESELLARKQSSVEEAETAQTTATAAVHSVRTAEAAVESVKSLDHQVNVRKHEVELAKANLENDKIALALANQHLSETKVYAPIDGVVSARTVQVGQIIASGINNIGGGTSVLTLSDLSRLFVLASVDESDIGQIALDQKVDITADSYPGKTFAGKVVRIAAKGVNTSNVVTFEVRIEVVGENKSLLKPEMTANVEIVIDERTNALMMPIGALSKQDGKSFTSLVQPGGFIKENIPIETGLSNGSDVEVVSGVQENDVVAYQQEGAEGVWKGKTQTQKQQGPPMMMGPPPGGK